VIDLLGEEKPGNTRSVELRKKSSQIQYVDSRSRPSGNIEYPPLAKIPCYILVQ